MGAAPSKLVATFSQYVSAAVDALLGLRRTLELITGMATSHLEEVLDADELAQFRELQLRKTMFIVRIQGFADVLATKLSIVKKRVTDPEVQNLAACYVGFHQQESMEALNQLQIECAKLRASFKHFHDDYKAKHPSKSECERVAKGCCAALVCLGCIALVILSFFPPAAIPCLAASAELMVGIGCAGFTISLVIAGSSMCKSEVERANDFLANMDERLRSLKNHLSAVRTGAVSLLLFQEGERTAIAARITKIITECDKIVGICEKL